MDLVTLALAKKGAKQYTDTAIINLPKGVVYKGSVDYYTNLPGDASLGDCYSVMYKGTSGTTAYGAEYVWGVNTSTSTQEWIKIGEDADLSDYATITYVNSIVGDINDILDDINGEVI